MTRLGMQKKSQHLKQKAAIERSKSMNETVKRLLKLTLRIVNIHQDESRTEERIREVSKGNGCDTGFDGMEICSRAP